MTLSKIAKLIKDGQPEQQVEVAGWVRTKRESKQAFAFLELNDGSSMAGLQVIVDDSVPGFAESIKAITTGASVRVAGELKESPGKGQSIELHAAELTVLGTADAQTYPLQKKRHSFEFLREIAHLRPRTNTFGAIARVRNALCAAVHNFFQARGFLYIHTPVITTSDCEGAGTMFQVTTLDLAKLAQVKTEIDYGQDFFGKQASLTVSGQLEAETFASSVGDCYTFGPTFRAENSNTSRHLAEFWMIEPEMAFADLQDDMKLGQEFVQYLVKYTMEECAEDLELFAQFVDKNLMTTLDNIVNNDFIRLPYTEAITILEQSGKKFEFDVAWGKDLQSEHERFLTEEHFKQPVIVYDYPKDIKAFYMRMNDDEKTVAAMDILVPAIGEIIGGSQREERYDVLKKRINDMNFDEADYWWYLDTRKYGTAPHAGFGLGFERLLMLVTGVSNIRDVIPFPRTPKHLEF